MNTVGKRLSAFLLMLLSLSGYSSALAEDSKALDARRKAIIPIAAHTATGEIPKLKTALNEGLSAGLTVNEVKEILIHTYAYAGFPRALNGINAFMSVLEDRKARGIDDEVGKEASPVPADFDSNAYGHKVRNALVRADISNRKTGYAAFAPTIDQFLVEHLFADIFYRDILNHQDRELATISILAAMTGTEAQLGSHYKVSRNVGITQVQLTEFVEVLRQSVSTSSAERARETMQSTLNARSK